MIKKQKATTNTKQNFKNELLPGQALGFLGQHTTKDQEALTAKSAGTTTGHPFWWEPVSSRQRASPQSGHPAGLGADSASILRPQPWIIAKREKPAGSTDVFVVGEGGNQNS